MENANKVLKALAQITRISNKADLSLDHKLQRILEEIVTLIGTDRASIMLMRGRKSLEVKASTNPDLIGVLVPTDSDTPSAWVVRNKRPLYVDKSSEKSFGDTAGNYRKNAFFCVPLLLDDRVAGVMSVTEKRTGDKLTLLERELLLEVCGHFIKTIEVERLRALLQERRDDLRKKNKRLRELEKVKNDLFNMLIHDLKGPIAELMSLQSILGGMIEDEETLTVLGAARTALAGLYRMVTNLLDVVRLEEGKVSINRVSVSPMGLVREAVEKISALASMKEVRLSTKFHPRPSAAPLFGDMDLLSRILQNLLNNAVKYSSIGDQVEAGYLHPHDRAITFFVKDQGPGVPDKYRDKIFGKFFCIENHREERAMSSGLGLAFCKLAVEAHGGEIGVEDLEGPGANFYFTLPLDDAPPETSA